MTVVAMSQPLRLGLPVFVILAGLIAFLVVAVLAWASWVLNDDEAPRGLLSC